MASEVSRATGKTTTRQTMMRIEKGDRGLTNEWIQTISAALGVRPTDLIAEVYPVPVVGRVGAGAEVYLVDDYPKGGGLYTVACPEGMSPDETVAVEVEGDSMAPTISAGWLLFYSRNHRAVPTEALYETCIVKLSDDGPVLVKRVIPGPNSKFTLESTNAPSKHGASLEWATPVERFMPPQPHLGEIETDGATA